MQNFVNLFDQCRHISAVEVAQREGLSLRQRGNRMWMCCPLHNEKTASLCLYEDGGWHCFGCHTGGSDGTSFLAALRKISQSEAARILIGNTPVHTVPDHRQRAGYDLRKCVKEWADDYRRQQSRISRNAKWLADYAAELIDENPAIEKVFWAALAEYAAAENELDMLEAAQDEPAWLYGYYQERGENHSV